MPQSNDCRFRLLSEFVFSKGKPTTSVVIPVFNQAPVIKETLHSLRDTLTISSELILINDSSEDSTLDVIVDWCSSLGTEAGYISSIRIFETLTQRFETSCDNFGFRSAVGNYILELQADILLTERGFDLRMIEAIEARDDLLALSGRGAESFENAFSLMIPKGGTTVSRGRTPMLHFFGTIVAPIRHLLGRLWLGLSKKEHRQDEHPTIEMVVNFPDQLAFSAERRAGHAGNIEMANRYPKNLIWLGETIMRGPILFKKHHLEALGFLDEGAFFLGYDDHDLCLRAAKSHLRVGFVPVGFRSEPHWGSSRKRRTLYSEYCLLRERFRVAKNWRMTETYAAAKSSNFPLVDWEVISFQKGSPH